MYSIVEKGIENIVVRVDYIFFEYINPIVASLCISKQNKLVI